MAPVGYAMGLVDRLLFRFVAVSLMRDQLLALMGRLQFIDFTAWGPGRVDTFEPPKALLGFRMDDVPPMQRTGIADFPSVWNQKARKGMWLHWDGNNCSVDERSAPAPRRSRSIVPRCCASLTFFGRKHNLSRSRGTASTRHWRLAAMLFTSSIVRTVMARGARRSERRATAVASEPSLPSSTFKLIRCA